ncbi:YueI family protein [Pediococcus ethanolidurans]|uniref:YueI family protein n=1 Tax=Pediococcus ethanolidurans TaxID=319653 RepID=UPI001C1F1435|nr:YueI family protein [Pediococcus ethanolidurans]MBU7562580.1 YueI family protein [Pediococcus ethanolidurans]MCT4398922.1 DUF1694 domain-containing protein [Pediococcus ethanolidurans]MCV3314487.1 YueI family protein [Pediococcus ethanolidurans]MCV3321137.1 YueI family protein [Pediococcus ethanolidurans]MDV7719219.1 DUF1694 domain-containing protein [Pediococcus ethanolidurans]
MDNKSNNVDSRLQNAMHGTPKLNPDEQRKYLGTFRERVALSMTVAQIKTQRFEKAFVNEMKKHSDYQLLINGNIDQSLIGPYMKAASQISLKFTIKTDSIYTTRDQDLALVLAAKESLNVTDIDVAHFETEVSSPEITHSTSLLDRLKNSFRN